MYEPLEKIGTYGGTLRTAHVDPDTSFAAFLDDYLFDWYYTIETSARKDALSLAKSYEFANAGKTLTISIREGIKWSDGQPFTTDDILFWYEGFLLNKEISPSWPQSFVAGGEIMKLSKVDDYTFMCNFEAPYWMAPIVFGDGMWLPKHNMAQYHIEYNAQANELAKKEDYDSWDKYFHFLEQPRHGRPTIGAMVLEKRTPEESWLVRKPSALQAERGQGKLLYPDLREHLRSGCCDGLQRNVF